MGRQLGLVNLNLFQIEPLSPRHGAHLIVVVKLSLTMEKGLLIVVPIHRSNSLLKHHTMKN